MSSALATRRLGIVVLSTIIVLFLFGILKSNFSVGHGLWQQRLSPEEQKKSTDLGSKIVDYLLAMREQETHAYDGKRPTFTTSVLFERILKECGNDKFSDSRNCLEYLKNRKADYMYEQPDVHGNEIVNVHVYWRGVPTWRVALLTKSFLFTQNLNMTRLHFWLDADYDPQILQKASLSWNLGLQFANEIHAGLVNIHEWRFPEKIARKRPQQLTTTNYDILHMYDEMDEQNNIVFPKRNQPKRAVAVSDAMRFIVLHLYGGLYVDADNIFLRDIRPLMTAPNVSFAERWSIHPKPYDYNTAIMRLNAYSELSAFMIDGAIKLGQSYHPRVLGKYLVEQRRNSELLMFETALFDPIWGEFDHGRTGKPNLPHFVNYAQAYSGAKIDGEWWGYDVAPRADVLPQLVSTFPGLNRTIEDFFPGAYLYHMHNNWALTAEPGSWIWTLDKAYGQWMNGRRTNLYGEPFYMNNIKTFSGNL